MADLSPDEETGLTGLLIDISNFVYDLCLGFGLIIPPFWLFDRFLGGKSGWGWALVALVVVTILVTLLRFAQDSVTKIVERIRNGDLFPELFRVVRHISSAIAMTASSAWSSPS